MEVASVGWVLGLVPAALVIAWGFGAASMLIPLLAAAIAIAVGWRPVSPEAAADRVDATFGTRELFGTTLRLRDTADGAWLAATADSTAHRLAAGDVPVTRFARRWWGGVAILTCATVAGGLLVQRGGTDVSPIADARLVPAGSLIADDASEDRKAIGSAARGGASAGPQRGAASFDRGLPAQPSAPGSEGGEAWDSASNASGGAATGGGAAVDEATTLARPQERPVGAAERSDAEGDATSGGGVTGSASDRPGVPTTSGDADTSRPGVTGRGSSGRAELPPGVDAAMLRSIPPAYHDLVRRYFSGQ